MNKKDSKRLLFQLKNYEEFAKFSDCFYILHQLANQYPNVTFFQEIAQTYYSNRNLDTLLNHIENTILSHPEYKKFCLLIKGLIYEEQEKLNDAEKMYLKALDIDYDYFDARNQLIKLYFYKNKRYQETIKHCELVFSYKNFDLIDKKNYSSTFKWLYSLWNPLFESYIYTDQYMKAIKIIEHKKQTLDIFFKGNYEDNFYDENIILFKLYYLLKDQKKSKELIYILKNYYKVSDEFIQGMKKDADQKYISNLNPENYKISKNNFN